MTFPVTFRAVPRDHMKSQHTIDWEVHSALAPELQKIFFDNGKKRGMHQLMDSSSDSIESQISDRIVNELIGSVFFNPEEDEEDKDSIPITKTNAMKFFKYDEDEDAFQVKIKNPLL